MATVEQLQCPACGSHEVKSIGGVNYQCDYCKSTFIVKNEQPFSHSGTNTETFTSTFKTTVTYQPPVKKTQPAKLIFVLAGIIFMVGIGISSFLLTNVNTGNNKPFNKWQQPGIDNYDCLAGSKGAVVWLVLKTQTNTLDSAKYVIRIIDPVTKKTISEQPLGKTQTWKDSFDHRNQFDYDYYVVNDTVYNISDEGGLQGFDLYSGKKFFGNEFFEKKFPKLKSGIVKLEKEYYKNSVKITSANGDDYTYCFKTNQLLSKDEENKINSDDRYFSEDVYLLRDKKSKLYLCDMKRNAEDDYYLQPDYVNNYLKDPLFSKTYIKKIQAINDSVYPKALPLGKYNNALLFFYGTDFSKKAKGILTLVNKKGKFLWRNNDTTFKKIVADSDNDFYIKHNLKDNVLVINFSGSPYQSMGIDLNTGKTQFVFTQSYSIKE